MARALSKSYLRPHRKIYKDSARIEIMVYTEIKKLNGKLYYYRVRSIRKGEKFKKERVYLGKNLNEKELQKEIGKADKELLKNKITDDIEKIKLKIIRILRKNNVKKAGIFGSYVRGEQKKNSDIDILIEPPQGIGFGFVGIILELEKKLGRKVHLITYKFISPYIKESISKEEVRII